MNKKDKERATFAWQYGVQAKKDGKPREVPEFWQKQARYWLRGFDGEVLDEEDEPDAG